MARRYRRRINCPRTSKSYPCATEAKRAAKEEQRQKRWEKEPQQEVKPWLVGATGAAFGSLPLPVVIVAIGTLGPNMVVSFIICTLYGGVAGMLIRRLGMLKALTIPVIPTFFLLAFNFAFIPDKASWNEVPLIVAVFLGPAVMGAWLAFWLHSRWARKRRMIDSGLVPP